MKAVRKTVELLSVVFLLGITPVTRAAITGTYVEHETNNGWNERANFGLGDDGTLSGPDREIFEANRGASVPELVTTITNLTPGEIYDVRVCYWQSTDVSSDWQVNAGFASGSYALFNKSNGIDTEIVEADRYLQEGFIGSAEADASGEISVYISNVAGAASTFYRTWYDGVAYSSSTNLYIDHETNNGWNERTGFGLGDYGTLAGPDREIFEANRGASVPELVTTITNLTPGKRYDVKVCYWQSTDVSADWQVNAGCASGSYTLFNKSNGIDTEIVEGDRYLQEGFIGSPEADASGEISVCISNVAGAASIFYRTWYDGLSYSPSTNLYIDHETNNGWTERTGFGFGDYGYGTLAGPDREIFQAMRGESVPELVTTITNLTPGKRYDVKVCYWQLTDVNSDWQVNAGFASGSYALFNKSNGIDTEIVEDNRYLQEGFIGSTEADASGEISVYISNVAGSYSTGYRTWYDGVAYSVSPPPKGTIILFR